MIPDSLTREEGSPAVCRAAGPIRLPALLRSAAGFTLVELMVVIALIGVLMSVALPQFLANLEQGRKAKCLSNRYHIDQDERAYFLINNTPSLAIDSRYQCPSGGIYAWLASDPTMSEYPRIGCSVHYGAMGLTMTSLGATFAQITSSLIDLINQYYQKNSKYPSSLGDIGVNAAEFAQPVNGLYYTYSPQAGTIVVEPTGGYLMTVNNLKGKALTLYPDSNKDLEYILADGTWFYFMDKNKNFQVNIDTLQVVKN